MSDMAEYLQRLIAEARARDELPAALWVEFADTFDSDAKAWPDAVFPELTETFPNERSTMNYQKILVRAVVTAVEMFLSLILVSGLTDLSVNAAKTAALSGAAAGLSVVYNALRTWLDTTEVG